MMQNVAEWEGDNGQGNVVGEARWAFESLMLRWIRTERIQVKLIGSRCFEKSFEINNCTKELVSTGRALPCLAMMAAKFGTTLDSSTVHSIHPALLSISQSHS